MRNFLLTVSQIRTILVLPVFVVAITLLFICEVLGGHNMKQTISGMFE